MQSKHFSYGNVQKTSEHLFYRLTNEQSVKKVKSAKRRKFYLSFCKLFYLTVKNVEKKSFEEPQLNIYNIYGT